MVECDLNDYGFGVEREVRGDIQTHSARSPIFTWSLPAKHRRCVREEAPVYWQPTSMHVPGLTGERDIAENRELVDHTDRHLET